MLNPHAQFEIERAIVRHDDRVLRREMKAYAWRYYDEPVVEVPVRRATGYTIRTVVLAGTSASAGSIATASAVTTAGDSVCFICSTEDSSKTLTSVQSSTGDLCSLVGPLDYNGGANRTYVAYKIGITGSGSDVWTATWSGVATFIDITGIAFAGGGSFVTSVKAGGGASTALNSGAVATSNVYALLLAFGAINNSVTFTMGNGFEPGATTNDHTGVGYKIQDRTGSYAAAMTSSISDTWACWVVEFAPASGITPQQTWKQGQGASIASTTSINVAYPGGLELGNGILCVIISKHANLPATPGGFALLATTSDGSGSGVDTGSVAISIYVATSAGSESGTTKTFTKTTETGTAIQGQMFRFVGAAGTSTSWAWAASTGTDSSTGTAVSFTCAADPGFITDDIACLCFADVSDVGTSLWGLSIAAAGATFAASVLDSNSATTQGDDMRTVVSHSQVTAGPSSAAPTTTGTANGTAVNSHRGAGAVVRVRSAGAAPIVTPGLNLAAFMAS